MIFSEFIVKKIRVGTAFRCLCNNFFMALDVIRTSFEPDNIMIIYVPVICVTAARLCTATMCHNTIYSAVSIIL